jgi:NADPH:quinone reductase-like Zn-dependent oxidoreductase
VVYDRYGPADVLRVDDVEAPTPAEGEIGVRVLAAGTNAGDWHLMRGSPFAVRLVVGGVLRAPTWRAPSRRWGSV